MILIQWTVYLSKTNIYRLSDKVRANIKDDTSKMLF